MNFTCRVAVSNPHHLVALLVYWLFCAAVHPTEAVGFLGDPLRVPRTNSHNNLLSGSSSSSSLSSTAVSSTTLSVDVAGTAGGSVSGASGVSAAMQVHAGKDAQSATSPVSWSLRDLMPPFRGPSRDGGDSGSGRLQGQVGSHSAPELSSFAAESSPSLSRSRSRSRPQIPQTVSLGLFGIGSRFPAMITDWVSDLAESLDDEEGYSAENNDLDESFDDIWMRQNLLDAASNEGAVESHPWSLSDSMARRSMKMLEPVTSLDYRAIDTLAKMKKTLSAVATSTYVLHQSVPIKLSAALPALTFVASLGSLASQFIQLARELDVGPAVATFVAKLTMPGNHVESAAHLLEEEMKMLQTSSEDPVGRLAQQWTRKVEPTSSIVSTIEDIPKRQVEQELIRLEIDICTVVGSAVSLAEALKCPGLDPLTASGVHVMVHGTRFVLEVAQLMMKPDLLTDDGGMLLLFTIVDGVNFIDYLHKHIGNAIDRSTKLLDDGVPGGYESARSSFSTENEDRSGFRRDDDDYYGEDLDEPDGDVESRDMKRESGWPVGEVNLFNVRWGRKVSRLVGQMMTIRNLWSRDSM